KLKSRAVILIAARFGGQVDYAAIETTELRRGAVGVDLEFLNGVDHREKGHLARFGLQNGNAIVEILIGSGPAAVDAGKPAAGRQGDTRNKRDQRDEVATIQGKIDNLAIADHLTQSSGFGSQERCILVDGDGFALTPHHQIDVDPNPFSRGQLNAFASETF